MSERVIFLVDMNAFFISCEIARHPHLAPLPCAVAGDPERRAGIILAANYPARSFGVRTAMTVHEARGLCPQLICVPPDHAYYRQVSGRVMAILQEYTPEWEPNSVDEAWLDMTDHLVEWSTPVEAAHAIMTQIRDEVGIGCSVGIAPNKFLAKMAADMKKPNGVTLLSMADVETRLWPLPIDALYGVGRKTAARLRGLGVRRVGDVSRLSPAYLETVFGQAGASIWRRAHGEGSDQVVRPDPDDVKSISRETTVSSNITDPARAARVLKPLAEDVARQAAGHGKRGRTVQLLMKEAVTFKRWTRQMQVEATQDPAIIYDAVCQLVARHWSPELALRLIGVGLTSLEEVDEADVEQIDLASWLAAQTSVQKPRMDLDRLGIPGLMRASDLERTPRKDSE